MSTNERKERIRQLRAEGYAAEQAGKSQSSCPYRHGDLIQWIQGWDTAREERAAAEAERRPKLSELLDEWWVLRYRHMTEDGHFMSELYDVKQRIDELVDSLRPKQG